MFKRYILLLVIMAISSCKGINEFAGNPTPNSLPEDVTITITPVLHTLTTDTPVPLPESMIYNCMDIADRPPSDYILEGTLVFNNDDNTSAFLWNNDTKNTYKFPREEGDRLLDFEVSPDRKHIKYQHYSVKTEEQWLVIATADGQPVWSEVIDSYNWKWFDNEHLIGLMVPEDDSPSLFILNPFSGERQELRTNYPDSVVFSGDWFPTWDFTHGGLPLYDPTLTRVIYPECDAECRDRLVHGDHGWPIVLRDIEKDQIIARLMTMDVYGRTPYWTPEGNQFILATKTDPTDPYYPANEFFSMTRDGQLEQLTHFMGQFEKVNIPDEYSLSPDGNLLAFWIVTKPSDYAGANLAFLNIDTGEVINYCVQGDPTVGVEAVLEYDLIAPIWSPDGTQLLVVSQDRVILVDLLAQYAAKIADDVKPVGWMLSP